MIFENKHTQTTTKANSRFYNNTMILSILLSVPALSVAFVGVNPPSSIFGIHRLAIFKLGYSVNPLKNESSEDRQRRMELVRDLRQVFYQNETGVAPPEFGIYRELPIQRNDWTELPGLQSAKNVTDADQVNLLLKVANGPKPWLYGHIYGSSSSGIDTGTLMQVAACDELADGTLSVVVQALERFVLIEQKDDKASVEILPDMELVYSLYEQAQNLVGAYDFALNDDIQGAACAGAVASMEQWHSYEFRPIDNNTVVPPVSTLNPNHAPSRSEEVIQDSMENYLSQSPSNLYEGECILGDDDLDVNFESSDNGSPSNVLALEHDLWIELDKLGKHLRKLNPRANMESPIPIPILGLLPSTDQTWPEGFQLDKYNKKMSNLYARLGNSRLLKSSQLQKPTLDTVENYPPLIRARRLSFVIWSLLDVCTANDMPVLRNKVLEDMCDPYEIPISRQELLEMTSTTQRLEAAKRRIESINAMLEEAMDI